MGTSHDIFAQNSLLFASLNEADRESLLSRARRVTYQPDATIFARMEPGDALLLIETGRVEISVTSMSGRKSVLNHMGPGEALGEIALLDGGPRSADVTAATQTTVLSLHRREVLDFLRDRPEAMMGLIAELCGKVRNASDMFATQAQTEAPARLARCLLRLVEKWGDDDLRLREFSQTDLGEFSGISRENVNRRLKQWEAEGIVALTPDGIVLHDLPTLEEIAQI